MIEQTDASKQSDERHVKNRRNTNLLTQKKTGGKDIMGNRGMTNWKLGAFFVIALTLMAGLFSSTALAGDGHGTIAVEAGDSTQLGTDNEFTGSDEELVANSEKNVLEFTYTAAEANDGRHY